MRNGILLVLLIVTSQSLQAELAWHDYDVTDHIPREIRLDGALATVAQRDVEGAAFKEDNLTLSFSGNRSGRHDIWFTSSYGSGSIAMEGRLLFLRYGIGRGTFARQEHVRIYLIGPVDDLEEMADVKVSSYVNLPGSNSEDPSLVEYQIRITQDKAAMTVAFTPPPIAGITFPEKSLIIAKKGEQVVAPNGL